MANKKVECPICMGDGRDPAGSVEGWKEDCPVCEGKGEIQPDFKHEETENDEF